MEQQSETLIWLLTLSATFGLIGIVVGVAGDKWCENDTMVIGLYSSRINEPMEKKVPRPDLLKFKDNKSFG